MPGDMNRVSISIAASVGVAMVAGAGVLVPSAPLEAQEVVQPLPPREAAELSAAMRRLAMSPTDIEALLSAGNASLALQDTSAAAGFFTRAAGLAPADPRVILGQARVALMQRRPVEALQGFARAESVGQRAADMAADRALAFDLVGDNASAQALYRSVLAAQESPEVRRRLALSLAISGNRAEFERTLFPLLRDEDRSAYRTRAFGLAILGQPDDAVEIADSMMPTDLALRMAPYLRYMPRLTKAQQAAAGNLGAFPAATEIGRDTASIAGYAAAGARIAARADSSLTPNGAALGRRPAAPAADTRPAGRDRPPAASPPPSGTRLASAPAPMPVSAQPVPRSTPSGARAAAGAPVVAAAVPAPAPISAQAPTPAPAPERIALAEAFSEFGNAPAAATGGQPASGAVDVVKLAAARRVADAAAARDREAAAKAKREADAKAAQARAEKAAKAAEPARRWIQVGVGRNTAAFGFDWRRLVRQAGSALDGKGPWAVKYGASNRMLAGPYASEAAVRAALKQLKDKNIEALPYSSDAGEKVSKAG